MAVAALICGIIGVVGSFVPIPFLSMFTLVFSIVGIVLGAKARKNPAQHRGVATAGMVLGIIGTVIAVIGFVFVVLLVGAVGGLASMAF